jgi:hypothetical protein
MADFTGFRQVGEFVQPRKIAVQPRNPLDKATIVSIYPRKIIEEKWTLQPRRWEIPAGNMREPSVTIIGPASFIRDMDPDQPLVEIVHPAMQMAESVINDYCNGLLAVERGVKMPGVFWILGEVTKLEVTAKYKKKLEEVANIQKAWFFELVRLADALRLAAEELGLNKVWIKDFQAVEMVRCQACGNLRNPQYPICPSCKVIDRSHPLAADLRFAQ